jgi:hypothetical protein
MFNWLKFLILVFVIAGCGKSVPEFENIDFTNWKNDKNACGQYRASVRPAIESQKDKLLALDEMQIVTLLGPPDRNELYKRNQKFYYYYIKPSPDCPSAGASTSRLVVRFNAMGLAKEVLIE